MGDSNTGRISTALLSGAGSPRRHAEDTQQASSPSHIILTPGQPVAALTPIAERQATVIRRRKSLNPFSTKGNLHHTLFQNFSSEWSFSYQEVKKFSFMLDEDGDIIAEMGENGRPISGLFTPLKIFRRSGLRNRENSQNTNDKTVHGWSVKFSKFPGDRTFGYAVMFPQATTECLEQPLKLLKTKFGFHEPGLLVSVTGDLKDDLSLQWTLNTFQDGLSLTLRTTGAWTLTNGLDSQLNRIVGEAHRARRSDVVPAVGVFQWEEALLRRSENSPASMRKQNQQYLEGNHSMFVFFEKGLNRLSPQQDHCIRLEKILVQRARMAFRALPVVKLLLGGSLSHLQKVQQAVENDIPVLVLQGTGGAADVLVEAMDELGFNHPDRQIDEDAMGDTNSNVESDNNTGSRLKLQAIKTVAYCKDNPDLLRKFDLSDITTAPSLQIAILKSALRGPKLSPKDKIVSFLSWEHDLSNLQTLSQALLQDVDMEALLAQKPKILGQMLKNALFARHFLTKILSILKISHIQALYQESKSILYPDPQTAPWKVTFQNIKDLLKNLHPPLESIGFYFHRTGESLSSNEEKIVHLFLWAVLSNRETVSRVLWEEVPEPLLAALVAYTILTQLSKKFNRPKLGLERHASMFEDLAVQLLDQYQETSVDHTRAVLSKKSLAWGKASSFRMAIESQAVMSHESFEPVINEVWMGDLANSNSRFKVFCYSLLQMRFCLTYKRAKGYKEMCSSSAAAPFIKYSRFMLSYLFFLAMYTINLLLGPEEAIPALDWLVAVWVISAFFEELTQVIRFRGISLMTALIFVPYLSFVIGFILRNPHNVIHYQIGSMTLSIALAFFYLSSLRFFLASRAIGIKVVMMREMMFNMVIFMIIMITIMFGYGIAIEVTLFPQANLTEHGARNLLRRPVWQLFGELLLEEIEGSPECANRTEAGEYEFICPSELGRKLAPAMTAIYMFITNVLLLNLLIAIFSTTYRKVEGSAVRYLNYESYRLAMEFAVRSYFPPPLSLIENIFSLIQRCLRCKRSTFEELAQKIHSQAIDEGMEAHKTKDDLKWEETMQDRFLEKMEERLGSNEIEDKFAKTLPRQSTILPGGSRKESLVGADMPASADDFISFRRIFLRQMGELSDRLQRLENHVLATSRDIRLTLQSSTSGETSASSRRKEFGEKGSGNASESIRHNTNC